MILKNDVASERLAGSSRANSNFFLILSLSHSRLNNTQNEVASEEMPVSLIDAEKMLKELEDLKVYM